jgi:hypothetical protein
MLHITKTSTHQPYKASNQERRSFHNSGVTEGEHIILNKFSWWTLWISRSEKRDYSAELDICTLASKVPRNL